MKTFEYPEIELIAMEMMDIITTSGGYTPDEDETPPIPAIY